ncbi:MAG: amidohydrolase family protein [Desulforhopalus sp.]
MTSRPLTAMFTEPDDKKGPGMKTVTAPWVVPVGMPVIRHGSVVTADDRIIDIGERNNIAGKYPHLPNTDYPCVLMPGLINCHTHLELSYLKDDLPVGDNNSFVDWVTAIVAARVSADVSGDVKLAMAQKMIEQLSCSGVAVICDTGNEYYADLEKLSANRSPRVMRLLEFLGPNREAVANALETIGSLAESVAVTAHSPYSTGPELLLEIKRRCIRNRQLFSIHTAESRDEKVFVCGGHGRFRDFLQQRNSWDGMFPFEESDFSGTVQYLHHLGLLDERTLLVHCVHVDVEEIMLIEKTSAKVCICPGSNRHLGVGIPPVEEMVDAGVLPGIGTDSLASNPKLDMWREMGLMAENHPEIPCWQIIEMATLGGAIALGLEKDYGNLAIGKKSSFIHVSSPSLLACRDENELLEKLVTEGKPTNLEWVTTDLSR